MIAVVDYGAGNLRSVANALEFVGASYRVVRSPQEVDRASKILLPGVGHFGQMMGALQESGMDTTLVSLGRAGIPIFGICLGMQVLYESSEEAPGIHGLGLLEGRILRLPERVKVPQMGWNEVTPSSLLASGPGEMLAPAQAGCGLEGEINPRNLNPHSLPEYLPLPSHDQSRRGPPPASPGEETRQQGFFYFANSFYAPTDEFTVGITEYGVQMSARVRKGNVEGVQFHPEKSGDAGLALLKDWCERC